MNFFITLVIFRFDPTHKTQMEFALVENGMQGVLPRIKLNNIKDPDPDQVISELLHQCLVIDQSWVNLKLVGLIQQDGIHCLYKINVPNTIVSSKSINWIPYDKLEEIENKTTKAMVRRSYHTY